MVAVWTYYLFVFLGILLISIFAIWQGLAMGWEMAVVNERRRRMKRREILSRDEWYETHFAAASLSPESSWAVAEKLAGSLDCRSTQILPDDFVIARRVDGRIVGLCSGDDVEVVFAFFDEWLDSLGAVHYAGRSELEAGIAGHVQTVADLIRWVEPFLTKKAKGTGLSDDDIG